MAALLELFFGVAAGLAPVPAVPMAAPLNAIVRNSRPEERRERESAGSDDDAAGVVRRGEFTIERRVILRVPMLQLAPDVAPDGARVAPTARHKPVERAPTCVLLSAMRGATIDSAAGILFIMRSSGRYRAILERGCRPIDFQSGFYVGGTSDGAICAGRDVLHARNGTACTVRAFVSVP